MFFEDQQESFRLASLHQILLISFLFDLLNDLVYIQIGNYTKYYSRREIYLFHYESHLSTILEMIRSEEIGL